MENYFVKNLETCKIEMHFEKSYFDALTDEQKKHIKSAFLWSRFGGCWISRAKEPNCYSALNVCKEIGLENAGEKGERLSFAEKMAEKAEKAERRAERFEAYSQSAEKRAENLQAPLNHMHGDIAFFTQPIHNTSAGRAFAKRRDKMFAAFEKGFDEMRKSEYFAERAVKASQAANQSELKSPAFVARRIAERETDIRGLKRSITENERIISELERGEKPCWDNGIPCDASRETIEKHTETLLDRLEVKLDELAFYQDALEKIGGVKFSKDNVKIGFVVSINGWRTAKVISTADKTFRVEDSNVAHPYSDITKIISAKEEKSVQPFQAGETFTVNRRVFDDENSWNFHEVPTEFRIIRATNTTVTIQCDGEKPFLKKPRRISDGRWALEVCRDCMIGNGIFYKDAVPETVAEVLPEPLPEPIPETVPETVREMTADEFCAYVETI